MSQVFITPEDRPRVDALRRRARRLDIHLSKSRQGNHYNNLGGFMLVDTYRNAVIAGDRYDLDLDSAAYWINHFGTSARAA